MRVCLSSTLVFVRKYQFGLCVVKAPQVFMPQGGASFDRSTRAVGDPDVGRQQNGEFCLEQTQAQIVIFIVKKETFVEVAGCCRDAHVE